MKSTGSEWLLTQQEAAAFLRLKVGTLESWRRLELGPPYIRLSNKAIRYRRCDLEAFIEKRTVYRGNKWQEF